MSIKIDKAIRAAIKIRDQISKNTADAKKLNAPLIDNLEKLGLFVMAKLEELGTDSFKADGNTAFKATKDSITIKDKEAFKTHLATTLLLTLQPYCYKNTEGDWHPSGNKDLEEHIKKLLDSGAFDLLTISANKNNCKTYMKDHDGVLPSGIDYRKELVVQFRKGAKK